MLLAGDPAGAARAHAFSARVRDVSEVLAELGEPRAPRHPIRGTVAYHDACHLAHAQGVRTQPRDALRTIPGLEIVSPAEPEVCCGSAGIYNLVLDPPKGRLTNAKTGLEAKIDDKCSSEIREYGRGNRDGRRYTSDRGNSAGRHEDEIGVSLARRRGSHASRGMACGRAARQLQAVLIDAAVVTLEQRAEARRIAVSHPLDQSFVGYCLHVRSSRLADKDGRGRKTLRYTSQQYEIRKQECPRE